MVTRETKPNPGGEQLVKSKERVRDLAEVNTPTWMVQKMLDQPGVKECADDVWATFLEPACGDGNFLTAILERKITAFSHANPRCQQKTFEYAAIGALTSIYGVDICHQNVEDAKANLIEMANRCYLNHTAINKKKWQPSEEFFRSQEAVVAETIRLGNALEDQRFLSFTEFSQAKGQSFYLRKFSLEDALLGRESTPAPRQDTPYQQNFGDLKERSVHYLKIGSPASERYSA